MSELGHKWFVKTEGESEKVSALAEQLSVTNSIANLLLQRGIESFDEAKHFFRPTLEDLHDPFLMKDMDKAIERIEEAFGNGERIMIYGDYDVDGTTSVSLVFSFFSKIYDNIEYYIPDRYAEGYGVSYKGIDTAIENGVSLIITLDCGIKAIDKVAYANDKGIDFVICDHHRPGTELPGALAVLDPKREDCNYPYDELPGCAIGFKLIQAFAQKNNYDFDSLIPYLDLVAISIACDIVPITGENRILAYYGIQEVNKQTRTGLRVILELLELKKDLTITDLVFIIGPRINAAGRISHATEAVELLITEDPKEAEIHASQINDHNQGRRDLDQQTTQQALEMIQNDDFFKEAKSTVLYHEEWHKGVIGIVASRVIESHYKPTIILTKNGDQATGSARSVKGFDVYNAIDACSELLEQFGGHKYAAGLTLKTENIELFRSKFDQVVASTITEEQLHPIIEIDEEIQLSEITSKFYRILKQFAPFGPRNMKPVFMTQCVLDSGYTKTVGAENSHLKLSVYQKGNTNFKVDGIAFNMGHLYPKISAGNPFDIVYQIEENEWQGKISLQLKIRDIRF